MSKGDRMSHHHHHHNHSHDNCTSEEKGLREKLKILVAHWMEHNNSHLQEYKKWENRAKEEGEIDLAEILKEVCEKVKEIDMLYKELEKLL